MIRPEIIKNKMVEIEECLKKIEPPLQKPSGTIIKDYFKLHTIERLFQLIVDAAIDINTHIIKGLDLPVPDDYQNTFTVLGQHNILPSDFALRIAPSVGLRNLVVHRYEKVDLRVMVKKIQNEIGDYHDYLRHINNFLKKRKQDDY